ncbi:DUF3987 domain-containing protein [Litoribacter alkaliphilus]|uniref:DUF3987 domain-containing protein n=1 Tax=Litoribacter ruber TaxID=702568 RepID=A0AAP2CDZ1_9BACT|nr:DUF3987 domain-containing protein [Litoribacter alkaliphilus]MBS9522393.1 DUF3987 domain-containing protein [Litoribacter alkaliphilus]
MTFNKQFPQISTDLQSVLSPNNNQSSFPLDIYPKELQEIINKVSAGRGIHPDYLASAILFSYGFAIGNNCSVSVLENSAQLKPILFMCIIGNSGSNKSSALKFAMRWFYKKDEEQYHLYKKDQDAYEAWLELDAKERATCPKVPPVRMQSILKDTTLEAIGDALAKNSRGVAQIRDEIAGFFRDLNKYRSGSDLENYLEMWCQDPVILNRVSKESAPILDPFLMLAGTTQPKVFEKALNSVFTNGSGFFDRFLYVWPKHTEKAKYQRVNIQEAVESFEESVKKIYGYSNEKKDVNINFSFSPEAETLILEWLNVYNKGLVDGADEAVASLYSKFDIHLQRICLILQFISWAFEEGDLESISIETTAKAIKLSEFFRRQSEQALDYLINTDPLERLKPYQLELYHKLPKKFKTSEGKNIASKVGLSERTFFYFLSNNPRLFTTIKPGVYEKL